MADKTLVTVTVRSGGLTLSDPGAVALAFNVSVRRAGEWVAVCPFHRGVASSEAELICLFEGRLATLERGGDAGRLSRVSAGSPRAKQRLPRGFVGVWMGCTVYLGCGSGFFESFPFLRIGRRLLAFVSPVA